METIKTRIVIHLTRDEFAQVINAQDSYSSVDSSHKLKPSINEVFNGISFWPILIVKGFTSTSRNCTTKLPEREIGKFDRLN
jgi:hypothetical protein